MHLQLFDQHTRVPGGTIRAIEVRGVAAAGLVSWNVAAGGCSVG
jgi:hypothetical protein